MTGEVVWAQRRSRHQRRYGNPARYPFVLHWGNHRLTRPAMLRTYGGARLLAGLWYLIGRRHLWIERRPS